MGVRVYSLGLIWKNWFLFYLIGSEFFEVFEMVFRFRGKVGFDFWLWFFAGWGWGRKGGSWVIYLFCIGLDIYFGFFFGFIIGI